jgi:hypothetical protein
MAEVLPCARCGSTERYADGRCAPCRRHRRRLARNAEAEKLRNKRYRATHKKECYAYTRSYRAAHPKTPEEKRLVWRKRYARMKQQDPEWVRVRSNRNKNNRRLRKRLQGLAAAMARIATDNSGLLT